MTTCQGSVHVMPIPPGRSDDDVIAELRVFRSLHPYRGEPTWAVVPCDGGADCWCGSTDRAPLFTEHDNGTLTAVWVLGWRLPDVVTRLLSRWWLR